MPSASEPSPRALVRAEIARALADLFLLPPRAAAYLARRASLRREIARLLAEPRTSRELSPPPPIPPLPGRALRIFVSCAESSGETHALSLVRALRARLAELGAPAPEIAALGGVRLEAEGVRHVGRPVERASMGFRGPLENLAYYRDLLRRAGEHFQRERPDVCAPVDSPALHVPLARIARASGVPVVHFVTPQHWAWAPWRASAYRAAVDRALSILPFEPAWFEARGVPVAHVGHPLLDALEAVPSTRPAADARDLVLLPGSRRGVIERNLPWMLRTAERLRQRLGARLGDVPVVVAHEDAEIRPLLLELVEESQARAFARVETGDLHGTLARARAALTVSGTVLLDLLHHRLPAVVVYRVSRREAWMSRRFLTVPWFSSVNLLAGSEVYPEFCFHGEGPQDDVLAALERACGDEEWRAACIRGLDLARERLGPPGSAARAAEHVLAAASARAAR